MHTSPIIQTTLQCGCYRFISSYGLNLIFLVLGRGICVIGLKQRKIEFKSRTKLSHNNNNKYCITSMTIRQLLMFKPNADTTATSLIIIIISRGGCSVRLVLNIDRGFIVIELIHNYYLIFIIFLIKNKEKRKIIY